MIRHAGGSGVKCRQSVFEVQSGLGAPSPLLSSMVASLSLVLLRLIFPALQGIMHQSQC